MKGAGGRGLVKLINQRHSHLGDHVLDDDHLIGIQVNLELRRRSSVVFHREQQVSEVVEVKLDEVARYFDLKGVVWRTGWRWSVDPCGARLSISTQMGGRSEVAVPFQSNYSCGKSRRGEIHPVQVGHLSQS